ncbi:MAG: glycosyltransferase, partial [Deltaproteobacteria bacterium]
SRISLVPSAVDGAFFEEGGPSDRASARAALGLPEKAFVVGAVAALAPEKELVRLVRAAAGMPGVALCLVGEGPERAALEAEASRLGVPLTLPGRAEGAPAVRRALWALDLFVLCSRMEGLPTAVLEAMAVGVPLVATRVGGVPEIVADGESGLLVPPGDEAALAHAIAALRQDPSERARLAEGGRLVAARHQVAAVVDRLEALYAEAR